MKTFAMRPLHRMTQKSEQTEARVFLVGESLVNVQQLQIAYYTRTGTHLSKPDAIAALLSVAGSQGIRKAMDKLAAEDVEG